MDEALPAKTEENIARPADGEDNFVPLTEAEENVITCQSAKDCRPTNQEVLKATYGWLRTLATIRKWSVVQTLAHTMFLGNGKT